MQAGTERQPLREVPDSARGTAITSADRPALVVFVSDEASEAAIRGGLGDILGGQMRRGTVRSAVKSLEKETTPRVLIVDISGVDDPFAALDDLATVCTPDVRVLVVGERTEISFYRDITRNVGVHEYLHKPLTRDNVARLFGPHVQGSGESSQDRGGQVTVVCGAHGGVGSTTIAVNLALELEEVTRSHVALLDLHLRGGAAAMMLGAKVTSGLRIALEEPERVDSLFLDRVAVPINDRVRLIAAEEAMDADVRPTEDGVRRVIDMLRQRFNHVVVDLPMPPGPMERAVLARARHVVVVMGPEVASIRDTVSLRKLVTASGAPGRVITVLNGAGRRGFLPTKLVAEGIGGPPDVVIPDLPRQLPRASNLGQPALKASSPLRRALEQLTQEIAAVRSSTARPSFLARLFGRGGG
ncbi:P-loop NTPase [Roseomonas sp. HF4]|uniref:AAA family ATPase n=1 Tax=Roseomonas sp. HF4 TaxID=2562313 RepID=UPI00197E6209|nr:P-loop NTPase [Roseomonas sp. HF4]